MKFKEGALPEDLLERLKYLYRLKEGLRLLHNKKAKELELSKFREFQEKWFIPRDNLLANEIPSCIAKLKKQYGEDSKIVVDIEDIEED